jgi:phage terminase large subunit-like protein
LLLAHLIGPEARRNSQLYSSAQSRDQAALIFGAAAKMVRMNQQLNELVKVRDSAKELYAVSTGARYKALSADSSTAHGLSPAVAFHDELGQVRGPRSELFEAIETGMGAVEEPLTIVISTQAPSDGDLLSILIDDALNSNDRRTRLFLYCADATDDPFDERTWYKANPGLNDFNSLSTMRELAAAARRMPARENAFKNLNLNMRVSAENHFVSSVVWASNGGAPDMEAFQNSPVWVGCDLSASKDLTAIVAVARRDNIWHVDPWFFLPGEGLIERARADRTPYDVWADQGYIVPIPGSKSIDEDFIAAYMAPRLSQLDVRAIAYDRWQFESLRKAFSRIGYEPPFLTDFGQGFKTMSPALKALEAALLAGQLRHANNPVLTMCMSNARVVNDDAGNRKLTKQRSTGRIDGAVALAMAIGAAAAEPAEDEPYWMKHGLLILRG